MFSYIMELSQEPKCVGFMSEENFYETSPIWEVANTIVPCNEETKQTIVFPSLKVTDGLLFSEDGFGPFIQVDRDKFLRPWYEDFRVQAEYLSKMPFEVFRDTQSGLLDAEKAYTGKYGAYAFLNGSMYTMLDFVRVATSGVRYYIGNIMIYHR